MERCSYCWYQMLRQRSALSTRTFLPHCLALFMAAHLNSCPEFRASLCLMFHASYKLCNRFLNLYSVQIRMYLIKRQMWTNMSAICCSNSKSRHNLSHLTTDIFSVWSVEVGRGCLNRLVIWSSLKNMNKNQSDLDSYWFSTGTSRRIKGLDTCK